MWHFCAHLRMVITAHAHHRVGGLERDLDRLSLRDGGGPHTFNPAEENG